MEYKDIIVLGSTGKVGSATIKALAQDNIKVTAGCRDIKKAKELEQAGAHLIQVDMNLSNQELSKILFGYKTVFIVTPGSANHLELTLNAINACKAAHISYVLVVSIPAADNQSIQLGRDFAEIEQYLKNSSLNYGIIRLPSFLDNILNQAYSIKYNNSFNGPFDGNIKFSSIAANDIAQAASKILQNPQKHLNKTYTITGDLISFNDYTKELTKLLKKEIKYLNVGFEGTKQNMIQYLPESYANSVLELFKLQEKEDPTQTIITNDFNFLTGKIHQASQVWIQQNLKYFQ
ncbi:hypothetical protein ABPG72_009629 [Tetrahymena utriculariae]